MALSEPAGSGRTASRTSLLDFAARGLDFASATHRRACALLVLVALIAFLPGFASIPPIDRDEARVSQATKPRLETGPFVDIR